MTRVRLADLGPRARAQIADALGNPEPRRRPSRSGIGEATPCPGHCHTGGCREPFDRFTLWLHHCKAAHDNRGRWEIDL